MMHCDSNAAVIKKRTVSFFIVHNIYLNPKTKGKIKVTITAQAQ